HITILLTLFLVTMMTSAYAQTANPASHGKVLRHVVLFKFKDDASPEDVKRVEQAFAALANKIKLIKDFEWGTNNSSEGLNQGLTHCFLVTFKTEKDRDAYLVHPDHKAFVDILRPHLEKATVVDYWAQ